MRKSVFILPIFLALSTAAQAYNVGETVFTCKYHRGIFDSGYRGCEAIVTQELGSSYRIEYVRDCDGNRQGQTKITGSNYLFPWAAITKVGWTYECDSSWF